jgi:hypothetical protein
MNSTEMVTLAEPRAFVAQGAVVALGYFNPAKIRSLVMSDRLHQ